MKRAVQFFQDLQQFVHQWWYGPAFCFLCAVDHYIVLIPVLGMLVSTVLLVPKKWFQLAIWGGVGSWLGVWSIGWLSHELGLTFLQEYFPSFMATSLWTWAEGFFARHGVWVVFVSGISPITQQPAVMIASLAGAPLLEIGAVLLVGIQIKFSLLAYLASHAPQALKRFRSVEKEVQELRSKDSLKN
jgi:membrane protein DedA with SNARE-associated domain